MHCMLMDLLHGFEVLSTTEETLFNSRNVSRLVQNKVNKVFEILSSIIFVHHTSDMQTLNTPSATALIWSLTNDDAS